MNAYIRTLSLAKRGIVNYFKKRPFCVSFEITHCCNAKCRHCHRGGRVKEQRATPQRFGEICRELKPTVVQVSGGEPLLQEGIGELAGALAALSGRTVLVETNGSLSISVLPENVIRIVDVKCPGSGHEDSFHIDNLDLMNMRDQVKFVICDRNDYEWASAFVLEHRLTEVCGAVLFVPAWGMLEPASLATWLRSDRLNVRLQIQLHKILGIK